MAAGVALLLPVWSGQAPQQPPSPATPQAPSMPAQSALGVVVLDPAHGGADAGARGRAGVLESEVVLAFARAVRAELERQGLRVVETRQGNENPSFDERSAVANAQRAAIFISLHVSSIGPLGTARAYSLAPVATPAARPALLPWDQAQDFFAGSSRRLAELMQVQLAQKFRGSPEVPATAAVRQLRSVAAPAIAIEVSSVAVGDPKQLAQMAQPLAEAVARAVAAFRPAYQPGGN